MANKTDEVLEQQLSEETSKLRASDNLIKRYLLEKGYEEGKLNSRMSHVDELYYQMRMLEGVQDGSLKIDPFQFEIWLNSLIRYKNLFGRYLKNSGLITPNSKVFELTESEDVSSLNTICVPTDKQKIIESVGEGCFGKPTATDVNGHLIANGMYDNELIYIARACEASAGSFSVGYCGLKSSKYTQRNIRYYKQMQNFLQTLASEPLTVLEDEFGRIITEEESEKDPSLKAGERAGKILVLNYRVKPNVQEEENYRVVQRQSDR